MNSRLIILLLLMLLVYITHAQKIHANNDFSTSGKKGFYNWKVYLTGHADSLKQIKEVVYTMHPTFKNPVQTVKASATNKNFAYSASGWGEFDIKIKVVFTGRHSPLYLVHHLKLGERKS